MPWMQKPTFQATSDYLEGSDTESSEDEDNCLSDDNTSLDDVTVDDIINEVFGDFDYGTDTGGTSTPDEMDVT